MLRFSSLPTSESSGLSNLVESARLLKNPLSARIDPRSGTIPASLGLFCSYMKSLSAQRRVFQQPGAFSEVGQKYPQNRSSSRFARPSEEACKGSVSEGSSVRTEKSINEVSGAYSTRMPPWTSLTSSQGSTPNALASFRRVFGRAPRLPDSRSAIVAREIPERSANSICEYDARSLNSRRRVGFSTPIPPDLFIQL
jgi:hypothetical protein